MSWLFGGTKKPSGKTVLMLDVENGSVAAGLVRLSKDKPPRLFAESRVHTPILRTRGAFDLAESIHKASVEVLQHTGLVAARMRGSGRLEGLGNIAETKVFLHAPWSTLTAHPQGWRWNHEPLMVEALTNAIDSTFATNPVSFHPFANAVLDTTNALFEKQDDFLLCTVTGEVAELLLVQGSTFAGRATIPIGVHLPIRTLQSHGNISLAEARSILALSRHDVPPHYAQSLSAAAAHFTQTFADAAKEIVGNNAIHSVLVVGAEPSATWVAKALSENAPSAENLFTQGAVVRALHTHHLLPHIAVHAPKPDLALLVESVFIGRFN
jgi:hypothetical protein